MTSPRKPGFVLPVAATLAVLLGLYVGAYYALVETYEFSWGHPAAFAILVVYPRVHGDADLPPFTSDVQRWQSFFSPIHWLDRRIRPHVWEPTP